MKKLTTLKKETIQTILGIAIFTIIPILIVILTVTTKF